MEAVAIQASTALQSGSLLLQSLITHSMQARPVASGGPDAEMEHLLCNAGRVSHGTRAVAAEVAAEVAMASTVVVGSSVVVVSSFVEVSSAASVFTGAATVGITPAVAYAAKAKQTAKITTRERFMLSRGSEGEK